MTDILDNPFDPFADAVEATLQGFRTEIAGLRGELTNALTEVRSLKSELETRAAPVIPEPVIDVEAIATRAAALVPAPKDGDDGKDAVVDYAKITEEVRGIITPMVTAEVSKIPAPSVDLDAVARNAAALVPKPLDGKDGIATREEIQSLVNDEVEKRVADVRVRTFVDSYRGVYKPDEQYARGEFATWGGSLFLAKSETRSKPGESTDWQLVVKRGADAKR